MLHCPPPLRPHQIQKQGGILLIHQSAREYSAIFLHHKLALTITSTQSRRCTSIEVKSYGVIKSMLCLSGPWQLSGWVGPLLVDHRHDFQSRGKKRVGGGHLHQSDLTRGASLQIKTCFLRRQKMITDLFVSSKNLNSGKANFRVFSRPI